jgi:hypothetical protein
MTTDSTPNAPLDWKELYKLAMVESDPSMLPGRIAEARHSILDRVEERLAKPLDPEHQQLHDALNGLRVLHQEYQRGLQEPGTGAISVPMPPAKPGR